MISINLDLLTKDSQFHKYILMIFIYFLRMEIWHFKDCPKKSDFLIHENFLKACLFATFSDNYV